MSYGNSLVTVSGMLSALFRIAEFRLRRLLLETGALQRLAAQFLERLPDLLVHRYS